MTILVGVIHKPNFELKYYTLILNKYSLRKKYIPNY